MTTPRKEKKREARREEKAERAAALDKVTYMSLMLLVYVDHVLSLQLSLSLYSFSAEH